MENSYESLTTLPLQSTQPTIVQPYWQNNYIHSLSPISQLTQTPMDSSYIYPNNTTPYYSNDTVQLPPDQNSYSFAPYLANANSFSAISTSSTSMPRTSTSSTSMPSSSSRQQENRVYYYV